MRYMNHVVERFGLGEHISLSTRVTAAQFDEQSNRWAIQTNRQTDQKINQAERVSAKYCMMATGSLSAPNKPPFPGIDSFKGEQ